MATKKAAVKEQKEPTYGVERHSTGMYYVTNNGERLTTVGFGFQFFDVPRTCSACEIAGVWVSERVFTNEAWTKAVVDYIQGDLETAARESGIGVYISFQHTPSDIQLLKLLGFTEFCEYPGNEDAVVYGLKLVMRDMGWEKKYDEDDYREDDDYQY